MSKRLRDHLREFHQNAKELDIAIGNEHASAAELHDAAAKAAGNAGPMALHHSALSNCHKALGERHRDYAQLHEDAADELGKLTSEDLEKASGVRARDVRPAAVPDQVRGSIPSNNPNATTKLISRPGGPSEGDGRSGADLSRVPQEHRHLFQRAAQPDQS